jgi:hypothetical protein
VSPDPKAWWLADKGAVHTSALNYVRSVDAVQAHLFNKFLRLEYLYDRNPRPGSVGLGGEAKDDGRMIENVIAGTVDTVAAQIATTDIRAIFDTDNADWSEQRKAKHREWYSEALAKLHDVAEKCQRGFQAGAATKGTGVNFVRTNRFKQITVESVMIDDIVVDELECRNSGPRQMHFRTPRNRDELKAEYPKHAAKIDTSQGGIAGNWRLWAGYRPLERNEVIVIESWRLPIGAKGKDGYVPGRHAIVIDGLDLLDEEYDDDFFPFAIMFWSKPARGWYGIGIAERIAGIQRALNRRNLQIERQLDLGAFPTTYVPLIDAALATKTTFNSVGNVATYKGGQAPTTVIPQAVSPETYRDADRLAAKAYEVSGVSRMASQAVKPAGLETGVALREYRDQTTQRFAMQEKAYERFFLDTIVLILHFCKKLGAAAPKVLRKTRFGSRTLEWKDVDLNDIKIQIGAASTLSRSRAGRQQTVIEWAQAGIISQDDARRLMDHPDLERALSLYTAAIENVEACLEEIADGNVVMPEPFMNLKLCVWRAQQQYLIWDKAGAPEEVLENLRTFTVQAAWMIGGDDADVTNQNQVAPGPDVSEPMLPAGAAPMPAGPPMEMPMAALAPQAMQILPS